MARQTTATKTRTGRSRSPSSTRRRAPARSARTTTRRPRAKRQPDLGRVKTSMGAKERELQRFLESFTADLTSGDGRAAAAAFEYPSLMVMSAVGEYGGNRAIADAETAASFFDQAPRQYHAKGIEETFPDIEDVQWIAHDLALVKAHFPYLDEDGNDMGDGETSVYVIRKVGREHRICAAITLGTDSDRAALRR